MTYLNKYWNDYKDQGLFVVETNISTTDDLQSFLDYCQLYDVQYHKLMNTDGGLKVPEVFNDNYANMKWLVFTDGTFKSNPVLGDILKSLNPDDVTPPEIELLAPIAQDVFIDANKIEVRWSASDENELYRISIYFSKDDGASYTKLGMTPGTMDFYSWYNPEVYSDKCRIKVVAADVGQNETEDESGNFAIVTSNTGVNEKSNNKAKDIGINMNGRKYMLPGCENVFMKIFTVRGQHVYTQNWKAITHSIKIKMPELTSGLYLMRMTSGKDALDYRVVLR